MKVTRGRGNGSTARSLVDKSCSPDLLLEESKGLDCVKMLVYTKKH